MQRECIKCDKSVDITYTEHFFDHVVEHFSCGHISKIVTRELGEVIRVSDSPSWSIIKDPIKELTGAEEDGDYFKLVSYACTVFEYYGKQILLWHFKKNNTPVGKDKIKSITLHSTIVMLYTNNLIDEPTYSKIMKVKELCNDFIHEDYSITYSSEFLEKMKSNGNLAFDCIRFLKKVYEDTVKARSLADAFSSYTDDSSEN